ncbi:hypothetical protein ACFCYM_15805 [Streptomyces sp. NPDC056254]|uniref:hypothetical protein n=1 Tax=Streptomyces sp. NPDC056254 TaxID=3345763 RepID=UPI0035DF051B
MADREQDLADVQRRHWQDTYTAHPGMYGERPSIPAVHAASVFRLAGATDLLELGAGHGRDALYFAREGFTVQAADFHFSPATWSTPSPRAGAWRRSTCSRKVICPAACGASPSPCPDGSGPDLTFRSELAFGLQPRCVHGVFVAG